MTTIVDQMGTKKFWERCIRTCQYEAGHNLNQTPDEVVKDKVFANGTIDPEFRPTLYSIINRQSPDNSRSKVSVEGLWFSWIMTILSYRFPSVARQLEALWARPRITSQS